LYEVAARWWLPSSSSSRDHIGGDDAERFMNALQGLKPLLAYVFLFPRLKPRATTTALIKRVAVKKNKICLSG
jgi:hypothetical protein